MHDVRTIQIIIPFNIFSNKQLMLLIENDCSEGKNPQYYSTFEVNKKNHNYTMYSILTILLYYFIVCLAI